MLREGGVEQQASQLLTVQYCCLALLAACYVLQHRDWILRQGQGNGSQQIHVDASHMLSVLQKWA